MSMPVFKSESDEADWWASDEGREFVKEKSAQSGSGGKTFRGSPLVAQMQKSGSVQIAVRIPESDLAELRSMAARKGIGYQTLLKMLVHEGLQREAQRH